jgi:signal peptidase I
VLVRIGLVLLVAVGVVAAAFFGLTRRYPVSSHAMEPTLARGSDVAVFRFWDTFSSPHRGDVVVLTAPPDAERLCGEDGTLVRRVIGLPGETVSEHTGRVFIDGRPLQEAYVKPADRDSRTAAWHVPSGEYFVMGDNRKASCDSRAFGPVPDNDISGRVLLTYWPVERVSTS